MRNIAFILKQNSEIRRFTALGIINCLLPKSEVDDIERKGTYVKFLWNKFRVKSKGGLIKEYAYTEPFFIKCLLAAFINFSISARKTIDIFIREEVGVDIEDICSEDDIERMVNMTNEE